MKRVASSLFLIALIVHSAGCSSKSSTPGTGGGGGGTTGKVVDPKPEPPKQDVTVELAAVTLADDCGGTLRPPPPTVKTADASEPQSPPPKEAPSAVAPASCVQGAQCGGGHRSCEQTSMQLAFHATGAQPSKIEVKKVELLDSGGAVIGELKVNTAMKWSESAGKYEPWDQMVAPGQDMSASYVLGAPDYNKLGGRETAHDKTYQVRVTVAVEGKDRTVEKKAVVPTMLEPAVPT